MIPFSWGKLLMNIFVILIMCKILEFRCETFTKDKKCLLQVPEVRKTSRLESSRIEKRHPGHVTSLDVSSEYAGSMFYCPSIPQWLPEEALIKSTNIPKANWSEGSLLVYRYQGKEFNCLSVKFESTFGILSLNGWMISSGNTTDHVRTYTVKYLTHRNVWEMFEEVYEVSLEPVQEIIDSPILVQEILVCPLDIEGCSCWVQFSVLGCLVRTHGPYEIVTLPDFMKEQEKCSGDYVWMDSCNELKPEMFYTNGGGKAENALFSNCGYSFLTLARKPIQKGCINELYYLEIEFPFIKKVSAIKIGGNVVSAFSFTLAYRNMYAAGVWTYIKSSRYKREFREVENYTYQPAEHVYKIRPLVITSGLRLYPQSWGNKDSSLKVDILACNLTLPVTPKIECHNNITEASDVKGRCEGKAP